MSVGVVECDVMGSLQVAGVNDDVGDAHDLMGQNYHLDETDGVNAREGCFTCNFCVEFELEFGGTWAKHERQLHVEENMSSMNSAFREYDVRKLAPNTGYVHHKTESGHTGTTVVFEKGDLGRERPACGAWGRGGCSGSPSVIMSQHACTVFPVLTRLTNVQPLPLAQVLEVLCFGVC